MNAPKPLTAWEKYERDMAMSLTEHATTSGYGYSTLRGMRLPLINNKISPSDLRRIIRRRQDHLENAINGGSPLDPITPGASSAPNHHPPLDAGKFREPRL